VTEQVEHSVRVDAILKASELGTWELTAASDEMAVNERVQEMFGYSPEEFSRQWRDLIHPDDSAKVSKTIRDHLEGLSKSFRCEYRTRRKDGTWLWILSAGNTTALDDSGRPLVVAGIYMDISQQKSLEEDLRSARERANTMADARRDFLARMSHEIRTPLSAILGFATILKEPELDEKERSDYLNTISMNGEHLLALVNDVLDMSKIESGALKVERTVCSLDSIVCSSVNGLRPKAIEKGLELRVASAGSPVPDVHADPLRVKQILVNLIGNAVKFTDKGSIVVTTRLARDGDGDWAEVAVADTGIGVPSNVVKTLFTPFEQADGSIARVFGGTGLGLSISKSLAEAMGGEIAFASEEGKGSTFTLRLPASETSQVPDLSSQTLKRSAVVDPLSRKEEPLAGIRILLAEDSPDIQMMTSHQLKRAGAEVELASDGDAAIRALGDENITVDLVLMDMQMPVMDGVVATKSLRQLGFRLPIIALTASALTEDRERCLSAGCDDFLTKPVDQHALIASCARWAQRGANVAPDLVDCPRDPS
jgi:PAS domain S-box-containing protein